MFSNLSEKDMVERDKIVESIRKAFATVTRSDAAISWNECVARDHYQPDDICELVRRSDRDSHWSELVNDSTWTPFPGIGGFSFINAEGFQYYLPPTMIRFLQGKNEGWYPGHLLTSIENFTDDEAITLWSEEQLCSIAHFVAFMALHDEEDQGIYWYGQASWADALENRWGAYIR